MPAGHLEQGEHWPWPSDDEKVPGEESASVRGFLLGGITTAESLLMADKDQDQSLKRLCFRLQR